MVAANAVLKAVSSSALTIPCGFPAESSIVTDPFGVVLWELRMDAGGRKEAPSIESLLAPEDIVVAGLRVNELKSAVGVLVEDGLDMLLEAADDIEDFLLWIASGCSRDTIFIPTVVPVDAGMNRVVTPFFLMTVRGGWKDAQHGELVSPVE